VFAAVENQLGLKLEAQDSLGDVLVIDSIQRPGNIVAVPAAPFQRGEQVDVRKDDGRLASPPVQTVVGEERDGDTTGRGWTWFRWSASAGERLEVSDASSPEGQIGPSVVQTRGLFGREVAMRISLALALAVSASIGVAGQNAARVIVLPIADAPLSLDAIHVNSTSLEFTATNTASKKVTAYNVSAFWFPPAGQRHGFTSQEQRPLASLRNGEAHHTIMSLADRGLTLGPETTLILAVRSATFDDGTSWSNDQLNARVDEKARELKLP
jgi:hypothetical protein